MNKETDQNEKGNSMHDKAKKQNIIDNTIVFLNKENNKSKQIDKYIICNK